MKKKISIAVWFQMVSDNITWWYRTDEILPEMSEDTTDPGLLKPQESVSTTDPYSVWHFDTIKVAHGDLDNKPPNWSNEVDRSEFDHVSSTSLIDEINDETLINK